VTDGRGWWAAIRWSFADERTAAQLIAVFIGAALTAVAAILYSGASGAWQLSVRSESDRTAALQEQVRTVYGDEAPVAFRVAAAETRTRALHTIEDPSRLVASEAEVAEQVAFRLSQTARPGSLAADRRYVLPEGGYDVPRRLADLLRSQPLPPDPDVARTDGDAQALRAGVVGLVTVLATSIAIVIAAMPRRRTPGRDVQEEPEVFPQPGLAAADRRRATILLLALWAAGVLLPLGQLALSAEEQRSQAAAARAAVQLSGQIAVSLTRSGFETNALRDAVFTDVAATARELAALDAPEPDATTERELARLEEAVAAVDRDIAARMGRVPDAVDGLDARTVAALRSDKPQWEATRATQKAETGRADVYGDWSNHAVAAIAVVAAATAWFELVMMLHHRPPPPGASLPLRRTARTAPRSGG
jgi:hypothetical protein